MQDVGGIFTNFENAFNTFHHTNNGHIYDLFLFQQDSKIGLF